ncbi:MAG: DUF4097 family beta strand repeat-containing protein [Vicinamibacterales bacterium]|nr:DUF4097 family beta strand repeat-containing protein [Vicinamibacterales bacterium]
MIRMPVTALALAATLAAAAPAAAQRVEERVDRTIAVQPGGTLTLKTFSGEVRITGTDRSEVVIRAVRRATRERLDRIQLEIESSGNDVRIEANRRPGRSRDNENNNVVETDFEIEVPRQYNLDLTTFSAPVVASGISGRHEIGGFSSSVRLTDVTGPIEARTFSGTIRIEAREWRDGDALDVKTFSGDIELRLPEGARADLEFNSFSGDLTSDLPLVLQSRRGRNVRASMNGGGTRMELRTFSGDATIRR